MAGPSNNSQDTGRDLVRSIIDCDAKMQWVPVDTVDYHIVSYAAVDIRVQGSADGCSDREAVLHSHGRISRYC